MSLETPDAIDAVDPQSQNQHDPSYIVGVGASAGGLEAIENFFERIEPDCGVAFVVVQHLSPDFNSLMDEILARRTTLRVMRAEHGQRVVANTVYLLTPRKNILLQDRTIQLVDQEPRQGLNLPIDVFFNSLALDVGDRGIAIVLSGTGSDGSRGVRAIKEAGGMVMVQDERSAKFDGMPRAAIATGLADFVMPPADLADQLQRFLNLPGFRENQPSRRLLKEPTKLDEIVRILISTKRADFSAYKPGTLSRRIERRMGLNHISDLDQYILLLRESEAEVASLTQDLLIGVTRFFRDNDAWESLRRVLIPKILADTPAEEPIRAWITACSTGEEAYSVAMMFEEGFAEFGTRRELKIFASDIDEAAIEIASLGQYPEVIAADVGPRRLNQFFLRRGSKYEVLRSVRESIVFVRHDLLKDPPFTKLNFVSCRNFLIYLQPSAQQRVLAMLHFALRPSGYLMLGSSETPGDLQFAFKTTEEKNRIYQKDPTKAVPITRHSPEMDLSARLRAPLSTPDRSVRPTADAPFRRAFDFISRSYFPPALLVSTEFELVHTFGDVSPYLRTPSGQFSADVNKLAVEDLRVALSTALHRATKSNESFSYRDLRVRTGNDLRVVNLQVTPIPAGPTESRLLLAIFDERRREPIDSGVELRLEDQKDSRIHDLEQELQQSKESLQAMIEELETSNEELQSTNEELLAANEELQSANEELHSVNEELYTVNAEYQSKIDELTRLTNDFDNLLRSTELGTIFVDRALRIRRFTPAVQNVIQLLDHDLGRPVQQFSATLRGVHIPTCVTRVIETGEPFVEEVQNESGAWFLLRVLPFVNNRNECDGAVLTLVPIDQIKASEQARRQSEQFLHATLDSLSAEIAILDESGEIIFVNRAWREFAKRNDWRAPNAGVGTNYLEVCENAARSTMRDEGANIRTIVAGIRSVIEGSQSEFMFEYPCHAPDEQRWFTVRVRPFESAGPRRVCIAHENITEQRLAQQALIQETERRQRSAEAARDSATQLAAIVENAVDSIITINERGEIQAVNAATGRMFGYHPDGLVGQNVSLLMPGPDSRRHDDYVAAYLRTGNAKIIGTGREVRARRKDGAIFPVHLSISEFWLGAERRFTGIIRDMSDEAIRIDALHRAAERLQASNRELEQFSVIASHDLQEPLRTIRGYCQLLRDQIEGKLDDREKLHLDRVDAAVNHLQNQIDAIRRYSQIGPEAMERTPTDVDQILDNVLASLESTMQRAGANIVREPMPRIAANAALLEQVFQNLIDNGIKHAGGAPQITIKSAVQPDEWVFGVSDNGVGIRPEHHERIFQMFKRLNPSSGLAGTGVGLSIAKRIVEKHGGRIWVESAPGTGSTFYFSIPRSDRPAADGRSEG